MKEFEIPPFYVGQEVVANQNSPRGYFKKGDEFVIVSIIKPCCSWVVDVGIKVDSVIYHVCHCGKPHLLGDSKYFYAKFFSPKIQLSDFISMKQLAETQLETIGAN